MNYSDLGKKIRDFDDWPLNTGCPLNTVTLYWFNGSFIQDILRRYHSSKDVHIKDSCYILSGSIFRAVFLLVDLIATSAMVNLDQSKLMRSPLTSLRNCGENFIANKIYIISLYYLTLLVPVCLCRLSKSIFYWAGKAYTVHVSNWIAK